MSDTYKWTLCIDHIAMLAYACVVANYCASDRVKGLVQQTNFSFLLLPISCFDVVVEVVDAMIEL